MFWQKALVLDLDMLTPTLTNT